MKEHVVTYAPDGGPLTVLHVPGDKCPFEVMAQLQARMGVKVLDPDPKFDAIIAQRAKDATPAAEAPAQQQPGDFPSAIPQPARADVEAAGGGTDPMSLPAPAVTGNVQPNASPREGQQAAAPHTGVRDTSMHAYRALLFSGKLQAQEQVVVDVFMKAPGQYTRQELARATGLGINAVCGRVNALLKEPLNVLVENGKKTCSVTGNSVNALELASA